MSVVEGRRVFEVGPLLDAGGLAGVIDTLTDLGRVLCFGASVIGDGELVADAEVLLGKVQDIIAQRRRGSNN